MYYSIVMATSIIESLRSFRIDGMTVFDFVSTFAAGEFVKWFFDINIPRSVLYSVLILLAITVHKITGQQTELNRKLFVNPEVLYITLVLIMMVHTSIYFSSVGKF
jgi:putative effector of murein hydrolase LrgA (UPF0299 family)